MLWSVSLVRVISGTFLLNTYLSVPDIRQAVLFNTSFPHRLALITAFAKIQDPYISARIQVRELSGTLQLSTFKDSSVSHNTQSHLETVEHLKFLVLLDPITSQVVQTKSNRHTAVFFDFIETAYQAIQASPDVGLLLWTFLAEFRVFNAKRTLIQLWRLKSAGTPPSCDLSTFDWSLEGQERPVRFRTEGATCVSDLVTLRKDCLAEFTEAPVTAEFAATPLTKHRERGKVSCTGKMLVRANKSDCVVCKDMNIVGRRGLHWKLHPVLEATAAMWVGVQCRLGEAAECAAEVEAEEWEQLQRDASEEARLRKADLMMEVGDKQNAVKEYWRLAKEGEEAAVRVTAGISSLL